MGFPAKYEGSTLSTHVLIVPSRRVHLSLSSPNQDRGARVKHITMAEEKNVSSQGADPAGTIITHTGADNTAADVVNKEGAAVDHDEENNLKCEGPANPEDQIDALGIPNWRELEKQVVRRLDITLMPCLWVLYLFNYLDRASIA